MELLQCCFICNNTFVSYVFVDVKCKSPFFFYDLVNCCQILENLTPISLNDHLFYAVVIFFFAFFPFSFLVKLELLTYM